MYFTNSFSQQIMDCPNIFDSSSYVLYLEPFLDRNTGLYSNIITINNIPLGPLSNIVIHISRPQLSEFSQDNTPLFVLSNCHKNFFSNKNSFLHACDIPSIISYLENNGYVINFSISKILHDSNINLGGSSNKKFICSFSYTS
jgi:hypothetical protein